jgi:hypothetical protein
MPWYMRKPVLAAVQGHALGAGCELAMFCDLTITADDAMSGEHRPLQSTLANKSIHWPSIAADGPTLPALL